MIDRAGAWLTTPTPRVAMLRRMALAASVAVVAFVVVWAISAARADSYRASARLSLTMEVRWPFYDAVREQQQVRLESNAVREPIEAVVRREFDGELHALSLQLPKSQSFLDLDAVASTPEAAAAAANLAAEAIIVADRDQDLARLTAGTSAAEAASITDVYRPRLELIRAAEVPDGPDRDPLLDALVAALLAGALAMAGSSVIAAGFGVAPTPESAARVSGLEPLGRIDGGGQVVNGFFANLDGVLCLTAVADDFDLSGAAEAVAEALRRHGRRVAVVSDRPGVIDAASGIDRVEALDPGEVARVSIADLSAEELTSTDFAGWLGSIADRVDVLVVIAPRTNRGQLLSPRGDVVLYLADGRVSLRQWRSLRDEVAGHAGQKLVLFADELPALDLRSGATREAVADARHG